MPMAWLLTSGWQHLEQRDFRLNQLHDFMLLISAHCKPVPVQVLQHLQPAGIVAVACLPAAAEELLFRGGLIPLVSPDWYAIPYDHHAQL